MSDDQEINWGYNCLTNGIHHGRPEAIWNIPLNYAISIYSAQTLKSLVIARVYTDALQIVGYNDAYNDAWATRVRENAEQIYDHTLTHKVGELSNYYKSPQFARDAEDAVRRVIDDKLNPFYAPLHGHDSVNMLCRIVGSGASQRTTV